MNAEKDGWGGRKNGMNLEIMSGGEIIGTDVDTWANRSEIRFAYLFRNSDREIQKHLDFARRAGWTVIDHRSAP